MRRKHLLITREDILVFLALLFNVIDFGVAMVGIFIDPHSEYEPTIGWLLLALTAMVFMFTTALWIERYGDDQR